MEQKNITLIFSMLLIITLLAACLTPSNIPTTGIQPTQTQAPAAAPTDLATGAATEPPVASPGAGLPVVGDGLCLNAYYPVRQGATWNYKSTGGPAGEYSFTDTITSVREDGFTLSTQMGGTTRTQEWGCQNDGLVALQFGGAPAAMLNAQNMQLNFNVNNAAGVTFPREIHAGDQWSHNLDFEGDVVVMNEHGTGTGNAQSSFSAVGIESVSVPAGTFDAMKIQVDSTFNMNVSYEGITLPVTVPASYTYWFVQGVGWVKASGTASLLGSSFTETTELQSYTIP